MIADISHRCIRAGCPGKHRIAVFIGVLAKAKALRLTAYCDAYYLLSFSARYTLKISL
jgi:hypothetical protein